MEDLGLKITPRTCGRSPCSSPVCIKGVNRFMKTKGGLVLVPPEGTVCSPKTLLGFYGGRDFTSGFYMHMLYELFGPVILLSSNCHT